MFRFSSVFEHSARQIRADFDLVGSAYRLPSRRYSLDELATLPENRLPRLVRECPTAMRYIHLLGKLDWTHFPERPDQRIWPDFPSIPFSAFAAACLLKINHNLVYMSDLRQYSVEHPALVWVFGFPVAPFVRFPWGFDAEASLPTERHFCRLLWQIPLKTLDYLLDGTVQRIRNELSREVDDFGQAISLDTKHIIAWVKENNPKE